MTNNFFESKEFRQALADSMREPIKKYLLPIGTSIEKLNGKNGKEILIIRKEKYENK